MVEGAKPRLRAPPTPRPADASPVWDTASLRVRREAKARFEEFRWSVSGPGRIVPHWEAFEMLLDLAQPFARLADREN